MVDIVDENGVPRDLCPPGALAIVRAHVRGLDRPAYLCGPPDHMALFEVSDTSL